MHVNSSARVEMSQSRNLKPNACTQGHPYQREKRDWTVRSIRKRTHMRCTYSVSPKLNSAIAIRSVPMTPFPFEIDSFRVQIAPGDEDWSAVTMKMPREKNFRKLIEFLRLMKTNVSSTSVFSSFFPKVVRSSTLQRSSDVNRIFSMGDLYWSKQFVHRLEMFDISINFRNSIGGKLSNSRLATKKLNKYRIRCIQRRLLFRVFQMEKLYLLLSIEDLINHEIVI